MFPTQKVLLSNVCNIRSPGPGSICLKSYLQDRVVKHWYLLVPERHGDRDHETSFKRGRLERFTTILHSCLGQSKPDRLLNKVLPPPSFGGGFVIQITVPYWLKMISFSVRFFLKFPNISSELEKSVLFDNGRSRATIFESAETVHILYCWCYLGDAIRCAVSADLKMVSHNFLKMSYGSGLNTFDLQAIKH